MTPKLFSELGLSAEVLKAIEKLGFEQAAPIQAAAIPVLMAGKDAVGQSQTGSGKTAAFGIPAIEKIDPNLRSVQVLILCPTRELAVQVSEEIHKLAIFKRGINALPIYGGQSYERPSGSGGPGLGAEAWRCDRHVSTRHVAGVPRPLTRLPALSPGL